LLVYPNGADRIYGNGMMWRYSPYNVSYPFTSWINTITTLAPGILTNFYFFIGRLNTYPSLKRLQIWRPVSESEPQYRLIWERIANFSGSDVPGWYIYKV